MKKLSELTMNELMAIQHVGIDASNFLQNNELYVNHIKPALEFQREKAKEDGEWTPNKTCNHDEIVLFSAFNSGKRQGLKGIEMVCAGIINRGADAAKEIERRRLHEKQRAG